MQLREITLIEDETNEVFASADCQQLLKMYVDFYPKIGFNIPWVGYFVERQGQIIGSCGFVGQPKDRKVEMHTGRSEHLKEKVLPPSSVKNLSISQPEQTPA